MSQVEELIQHLNEDSHSYDGTNIEIAYSVNPELKLVTPGINIIADGFEKPLFLTIGELRELADQAEEQVNLLMNK